MKGKAHIRVALIVAALSAAAAILSRGVSPTGDGVPLFWLPAGVILGSLLLFEFRRWWIVIAVSGAVDLAISFEPEIGHIRHTLLHHAAISVAALAAAWLIKRYVAAVPRLTSFRELAGMLGISTALLLLGMGAIHSPVWMGARGASELLPRFVSAFCGMLLVAPAMLAWSGRPTGSWTGLQDRRWLEAGLLAVLTVSVVVMGKAIDPEDALHGAPLVPLLLWATFRFGIRGITAANLLIAGSAVWLMAHDSSLLPFGHTMAEARMNLGLLALFSLVPAVVLEAHHVTESALRSSEQRFRLIFERSADALLLLDAGAGRFIDCNQAAAEMLGCKDRRDALLIHPSKLSPPHQPDGRPSFEKAEEMIATALRQGSHRFEWTHCSEFREPFPVEVQLTPILFGDKQVILTAWRDISERKENENIQAALFRIAEAAQAAPSLQELYRRIHEIIGGLLPAKNFFVALHDRANDLLRFPYFVDEYDPAPAPLPPSKGGLTGRVLRSGQPLMLTSDAAAATAADETMIGTPPVDWLGVPLVTDDRAIGVIVVQSYTGTVRYTTHDLDLLQFVSRQVAASIAHKQAQEALRESENRFRLMFERTADALLLIDPQTNSFVDCNQATADMLRYPSRPSVLKLHPAELSPPEQPDGRPSRIKANEMIAEALRKGSHRFEWTHCSPHRAPFPVEVLLTPIQTGQGQLIITTWRDLSERKSLEDQLRQSQKMEVVGQLAGGIAHDFNNILTAMSLNIELLEHTCVLPSDARQFTAELGAMAKRAGKLTEQLVMFARRQALQVRPLELNQALQNLSGMLHRLLGEQIRIRHEGADRPLWIEGDAGTLDHAIINLCINARDAMPSGGTLTLATSVVEIAPEDLARRPDAKTGTFACLSITDTGHGMSPDILEHVFEPFFTTKEVGSGTGLGLASVHGIIHQHRGWVEVESAVGQGTTFRLYLPKAQQPPEAPSASAGTPAEARRNTCVLLVEDEMVVRDVSEAMLTHHGFRVLTAADATEALAVWAGAAAEIDLLLTDMRMPGPMNGLELGQHLRAEKPSLKVILMSGYSAEIVRGLELSTSNLRFLSKPFQTAALLKAIEESLAN